MKRLALLLVGMYGLFSLLTMSNDASAAPVQVLQNTWPTNETGLAFWQYNQYITYQVCCKAPAPPEGTSSGGGAFKNGDGGNSGQGGGVAGQWATIWQDFSLDERGVPLSDTYNVSLEWLVISVTPSSGHNILNASLYGWDDGQSPQYLGDIYQFEEIGGVETPACDTTTYWPKHCSDVMEVPHFDNFRFEVNSFFSQSDATLGMKWTGLDLTFDPVSTVPPTATPTPVITPTPTPVPPTPTPSPSLIFIPMFPNQNAILQSADCNMTVVSETVSEIVVECR